MAASQPKYELAAFDKRMVDPLLVFAGVAVVGAAVLGAITTLRARRVLRSGRTFDPNGVPDTKEDQSWLDDHRRRIATFPAPIREAHAHSSNHRGEILGSQKCGCFYCGQIFPPDKIAEWTDPTDEDSDGTTAMCPFCGIDSVIGDRSGFPITDAFLLDLNKYWF